MSTQHPGQSFYAAYTAAVDRLRDLLASIDQAVPGGRSGREPAAHLHPRRAAGDCAVSRLPPARGAAGGVQRHPGGRRAGAYDTQIVNWLTGWDDPTCRTIASLMWRCRLAGGAGGKKKAT